MCRMAYFLVRGLVWSSGIPLLGCAPSIDSRPVPYPAAAAPAIREFSDGYAVLLEPITYGVLDHDDSLTVPAGFVTDFASIPGIFRWLIPAQGPYRLAAVLHDFLYWEQHTCTREEADWHLVIAMHQNGAWGYRMGAVFAGPYLKGTSAWQRNARDRREGLPRIIPERFLRIPRNVRWTEYRIWLREQGEGPNAPIGIPESFCDLGSQRTARQVARKLKAIADSAAVGARDGMFRGGTVR